MRAAAHQLARLCAEAASVTPPRGQPRWPAGCDARVVASCADLPTTSGRPFSAPAAAPQRHPRKARSVFHNRSNAAALELKTASRWADAVANAAEDLDLKGSIDALDALSYLLPGKLQREAAFRAEQLLRTVCARAESMDVPRLSRVVRLLGKLSSGGPDMAAVFSTSQHATAALRGILARVIALDNSKLAPEGYLGLLSGLSHLNAPNMCAAPLRPRSRTLRWAAGPHLLAACRLSGMKEDLHAATNVVLSATPTVCGHMDAKEVVTACATVRRMLRIASAEERLTRHMRYRSRRKLHADALVALGKQCVNRQGSFTLKVRCRARADILRAPVQSRAARNVSGGVAGAVRRGGGAGSGGTRGRAAAAGHAQCLHSGHHHAREHGRHHS